MSKYSESFFVSFLIDFENSATLVVKVKFKINGSEESMCLF